MRGQLDQVSNPKASGSKKQTQDMRIQPAEILDLESLQVPRSLTHTYSGYKFDPREFAHAWRYWKPTGMGTPGMVMGWWDQWLFPPPARSVKPARVVPVAAAAGATAAPELDASCPLENSPLPDIDLIISPAPATRISREKYEAALVEEEANDAAASGVISGGGASPVTVAAAAAVQERVRTIVSAEQTRTILSKRLRAVAKAKPFSRVLSEEMKRRNEHLPDAGQYAACHRLPHARCVDIILYLMSRGLDSLAAYVLLFSHSPANILLSTHNGIHSRMEQVLESDDASREYPDGTVVTRAQALAWKGKAIVYAINHMVKQVPEVVKAVLQVLERSGKNYARLIQAIQAHTADGQITFTLNLTSAAPAGSKAGNTHRQRLKETIQQARGRQEMAELNREHAAFLKKCGGGSSSSSSHNSGTSSGRTDYTYADGSYDSSFGMSSSSSSSGSGTHASPCLHYVPDYDRSDGTHVSGHWKGGH